MNIKVCVVIVIGGLGILALCLYPPWEFDGIYRGHSSVFNTVFMTLDRSNLLFKAGLILLTTLVLSVILWNRDST